MITVVQIVLAISVVGAAATIVIVLVLNSR